MRSRTSTNGAPLLLAVPPIWWRVLNADALAQRVVSFHFSGQLALRVDGEGMAMPALLANLSVKSRSTSSW